MTAILLDSQMSVREQVEAAVGRPLSPTQRDLLATLLAQEIAALLSLATRLWSGEPLTPGIATEARERAERAVNATKPGAESLAERRVTTAIVNELHRHRQAQLDTETHSAKWVIDSALRQVIDQMAFLPIGAIANAAHDVALDGLSTCKRCQQRPATTSAGLCSECGRKPVSLRAVA